MRPHALPSSAGPQLWLLAVVGAGALALQLLLWSRTSAEELRLGALCAVALIAILWSRRDDLLLGAGPASTAAGGLLLGAFAARTAAGADGLFLTLAPVLWSLGVAWLASGLRRTGDYWRELTIVGAMVAPPLVETLTLDVLGIDITPFTARCTAGLLRAIGWNATARDFFVDLPGHSVAVAQGCSGLRTIAFLVGFAVIALLFHPVRGAWRNAVIFSAAVPIGFLVNAVRVCLLALVAANPGAFKFWHIQQGAMFFEVVAIGLFLGCFYLLAPSAPPAPPAPRP